MKNTEYKENINAEIIKEIAELIHMSFRHSNEPITRAVIQKKIKLFNDWNNESKFYDFALNLIEEEKTMIENQVCAWCGI